MKLSVSKRCISLLLAIVLFASFILTGALADTSYYVTFNALGKDSSDNFRQWASDLINYYRQEYACVDRYNTYDYITYMYYCRQGDLYIPQPSKEYAAIYYPYYRVADRKNDYNLSENIYENLGIAKNLYNNNKGTIAYRETFLNEGERNELYLWMLKETLAEKLVIDSEFTLSASDRTSVFSVKSGRLVKDTQASGTVDYASRDAVQKMTNYLLDGLDFALQTYMEVKRVETEAENLVKDTVDESLKKEMYLTNSGTYIKKWKEEFIKKLQNNAIDEIFGALRDINLIFSENDKKEIRLQMRSAMAEELAAEVADMNSKAINYMEKTYLSSRNAALGMVSEFEESAEKLIKILDSKEITDLIAGSVMDEVTAKITDQIMEGFELKIENILSQTEIAKTIAESIMGHLLTFVENSLKDLANEGLKQFEKFVSEKIKGKFSQGKVKAMLTEIVNFINKDIIQDELIDRMFKALKEVKFEKYMINALSESESDESAEKKDLGNEIASAFEKHFGGDSNSKIESFETAFRTKTIGFFVKELMYLIMGNKFKQEDQINAARKKDEKNYQITELTSMFVNDATNPIGAVLSSLLRGIMATVKSTVDNEIRNGQSAGRLAKLTNEQVMEYDHVSKLIDEAMKEWTKVEADKQGKVSQTADASAKTTQALVEAFAWMSKLDAESADYLWEAVASGWTMDDMEAGIKQVLKDKDLTDLLFQTFFGQTIKQTVKNETTYTLKEFKEGDFGDYRGYDQTAEIIENAVKEELDANKQNLESAVAILQKVWDKGVKATDSCLEASMSLLCLITGEHSASLYGERARVVAEESRKLEGAILSSTSVSRMDIVGYDLDRIQTVFVKGNDINCYKMTAEDVLNPEITPDLDHIKALTNMILLQMHLDTVGMSDLLTVISQRDGLLYSQLYSQYLSTTGYRNGKGSSNDLDEPYSVLLDIDKAKDLYEKIVNGINRFESSMPGI